MARINLLPWREELREEHKKQFLITLFGVLIAAVVLVFLADQVIGAMLEQQNARNNYLKREIATLDERIRQVRAIRELREQLLSRMEVIQDLQGNRTVMPRLFDQIVRTLPDGVYYSTLSKQGTRLSINGFAESNNRVSALMRNMDDSPWLTSSTLSGVRAIENAHLDGQANQFQMTVQQSRPKAATEGQGDVQ